MEDFDIIKKSFRMAHFMPIKECIIMNKEIKEFLEGLKGKKSCLCWWVLQMYPVQNGLLKNGVSVYACDGKIKEFIGKRNLQGT